MLEKYQYWLLQQLERWSTSTFLFVLHKAYGLTIMVRIFLSILLPFAVTATEETENNNSFMNSFKWIDRINNDPNSTWKAGENFQSDVNKINLNYLLGTLSKSKNTVKLPTRTHLSGINNESIPQTFDARIKWSKCKSIINIRDQGNCGSCWAVAAASAFSDRLCIATQEKFNGLLSAEDLFCCPNCGEGCKGGYPENAWNYFLNKGIVTGGDYNSFEGCKPYSITPCSHHISGEHPKCSSLITEKTPICKNFCSNKNYTVPYSEDLKRVINAYAVCASEVEIQKEILRYGPVEAAFTVYEDFLTYKSGVYRRAANKSLGGHAVKIIGWGVENNLPYWLAHNSWNTNWGDKGLFKIYRGADECGIESRIIAGIPKGVVVPEDSSYSSAGFSIKQHNIQMILKFVLVSLVIFDLT